MSNAQPNVTATWKNTIVTFGCHAETAKAVFLAGSFNNWDPKATPMKRNRRGEWAVSLSLGHGRYEYKFVVDGEWCCEPGCTASEIHCAHCTNNDFGTMNRVFEA
jgi:1,4-alpha-glucan branching enzyme